MSNASVSLVNPYQSPAAAPQPRALPTFARVVVGIDCIFLALRAMALPASVVALSVAASDPIVARTGLFELTCAIAILVTGVPAATGLLQRRKWAVPLAWAKFVAVLASMLIALLQLAIMTDDMPAGSPEFIGFVIGASVTLGIRLVLNGLYAAAVVQCAKSFQGTNAS